jgi:hypothetical protein
VNLEVKSPSSPLLLGSTVDLAALLQFLQHLETNVTELKITNPNTIDLNPGASSSPDRLVLCGEIMVSALRCDDLV